VASSKVTFITIGRTGTGQNLKKIKVESSTLKKGLWGEEVIYKRVTLVKKKSQDRGPTTEPGRVWKKKTEERSIGLEPKGN